MHFAMAARSEAHLNAGNILGRRKDAFSHVVDPSTLLNPLLHQTEGIPNGYYVPVIGGRRVFEFGFSSRRGLFSGPGSLMEWSCSAFCVLAFS